MSLSPPRVPASYPNPKIVCSQESIQKQISVVPTLPNSSTPEGEYAAVFTFDFAAPENNATLNIKWVKVSVYDAYRSLIRTPGAVLTITTDTEEVFIGKVTGASRKNLDGTEVYEVDISMRRTN
jgi:hypothetical protein